jgi:hypothetical protein
MLTKIKLLIPILVFSLVFTNCQQSTQKSEITEHDTVIAEFNTMFGVRGSLQSVVTIMINSGAKYNPEITLDTVIKDAYFSNLENSAFMCGIFSSDAIYHSAFGYSEKAFESYTSAQILANHLGIGPFYVGTLLTRRNQGITEADSVLFKFEEVLHAADTSIDKEKSMRIIVAYVLGNYIEKLFLIDNAISSLEGTKISDLSEEGKFLMRLQLSTSSSTDKLVEILDKYMKEKGSLYQELVVLQSLDKEFEQAGLPEFNNDEVFKRTKELIDLSMQVQKIRELIVVD